MKVAIDIEIRHGGRSGVEARVPELRLTGHGYDEEQAKESLRRGVVAWCEGLQSIGKLEEALRGKKIFREDNGGLLDIELRSSINQA